MLEKYYNMGSWDRLLRFFAGWAMIFLGFVYTDAIHDDLLNTLVGVFGALNVISSVVKVCPAYLLAKISTIRRIAPDRQDSTAQSAHESVTNELQSNGALRRKLQVSVALPMLALLVIFAVIAYDLNHRFELASLTREIDVVAEIAARQRLLSLEQASDAAADEAGRFSVEKVVGDIVASADLFVHHDRQGRLIPNSFGQGSADTELAKVWATKASSSLMASDSAARGMLMVGKEHFIWSSTHVGDTDEWFTAIIKSSEHHSISAYFLSPEFLVLIVAVMWLAIWSSTYIVRLFVDKMEYNSVQLHHRSTHDALTGLPNRQKIESIVSQRLQTLNKDSECVVLIMIDIIDFRVINDTLGYTLGDQLLVQVGEYLKEVEPETTELVRMGGDIFCLVAVVGQDRINASRLANSVHDRLECTHELNGIPVGLQVRTGLAIGPVDSGKPEDLVRFADIALAQAKSQRTKDCFYQHDQDSHSIRKLALLARLRTAIEQNELTLVYQPKVDIITQTLVGVEVLVRWNDAEYGTVSPVEFVSWAERSGLIDKLTRWVLTNAEKQCREWRDRGYVIPFAVNLSPTNLYDMKLIPLIKTLMSEGSFGNGMLELEITENAVMEDPENAVQAMRVLDSMGVKFAIDDFGTGLSSFSYLRTLPVSNLKIDRAFIADTGQSDKDAVLLRSMIKLGHGLGCVVTAEGVEDQETLERLRDYGCNLVQGYHVCRPVPAEEFIRWVQSCEWQSSRRAA